MEWTDSYQNSSSIGGWQTDWFSEVTVSSNWSIFNQNIASFLFDRIVVKQQECRNFRDRGWAKTSRVPINAVFILDCNVQRKSVFGVLWGNLETRNVRNNGNSVHFVQLNSQVFGSVNRPEASSSRDRSKTILSDFQVVKFEIVKISAYSQIAHLHRFKSHFSVFGFYRNVCRVRLKEYSFPSYCRGVRDSVYIRNGQSGTWSLGKWSWVAGLKVFSIRSSRGYDRQRV